MTLSKKLLLPVLIATGVCTGCMKEEEFQPRPDATAVIQKMIAEHPDCTCDPFLAEFQWKGETIFLLGYKGPACSWFPTYYDSFGNQITLDKAAQENFTQKAKFIREVWSCS